MDTQLLLHEELLLLVLKDEVGSGRSDVAVGGGLLAELALQGAVEIEKVKRTWKVQVAATTPVLTNELLAECIDDIRSSSKTRSAMDWVTRFSQKKNLKHRVAEPLVANGILSEEQRKILFFTTTRYPELNPLPEAEMTERLRFAIESDGPESNERTIALIALGNAAGLLANNLDRKMLRKRKARIKELSDGSTAGGAVEAVVDSVNAAVIAAITASTASAAAATS